MSLLPRALLVSSLALSPAALAQFTSGDVYLASVALTSPGFPCGGPTVLRFNPHTWQSTVVAHPPTGFSGRVQYDPARAAILLGYNDSTIEMMNSAGVRTPLPYAGSGSAQLFAPTGDGRIYIWGTIGGPIRFYDAGNALRTLMNAANSAPFTVSSQMGAFTYDAGTNCLFYTSNISGDLTQVTKVPLTGDGARVAGATTSISFDASPGFNTEIGVGFSRGPNGTLFLDIDDNGGGDIGRMQLINPVAMTQQVFSTCSYFGVGGQIAGAYVPSISKAVVFDTLNGVLRTYAPGAGGAGTIVTPNLAAGCGSGYTSQLIVIDAPATCPADLDDGTGTGTPDGGVTIDDLLFYLRVFASGDVRGDLDDGSGAGTRDGGVTIDDLLYFLAHFAAGC